MDRDVVRVVVEGEWARARDIVGRVVKDVRVKDRTVVVVVGQDAQRFERMLRRLLVLNKYGYTIDLPDLDNDKSEHEFLSDEWLVEWHGEDWCPGYVQDELDVVNISMSARRIEVQE